MAGISVAVLPDKGAPQVGVTIDGLDPASVVTVDRSWDGGLTWRSVRGLLSATVAGGSTFVRDHVPPLNVAATYRLTVERGATPATTEATITVPSDRAWLQDPLRPRNAVAVSVSRLGNGDVLLAQGSLASAKWQQATDVVVPSGSTYPVASIGQRLMASEVPLALSVEGMAAEATALYRLIMSAGTLVLRGHPAGPLEAVAHISLGDADTAYLGRGQITTWTGKARQVRPASLRIIVPWWTYDQVKAERATANLPATYATIKAARPADSYLDWLARPVA